MKKLIKYLDIHGSSDEEIIVFFWLDHETINL